jgi:hypothetical protein
LRKIAAGRLYACDYAPAAAKGNSSEEGLPVSVRACNHYAFAAKFDQPDNLERLRQLLANLLRWRFPGLLPAQVQAAANRGVDRVRSGTMSHWPHNPEVLTQESAPLGPAPPWTVAPTFLWAFPWLAELACLLVLTRRCWAYLYLFTARRPGWTWLGPLADLYLGQQPVFLLEDPRDELIQVLEQLHAASAVLGSSSDPLVQWLGDLGGFYPNWSDFLGGFPPASVAYPALRLALGDLSRLAAAHPSHLHDAQLQLAHEVAAPLPEATVDVPEELLAWLGRLPADFDQERLPRAVVEGLRRRYPVVSPVVGDERATRQELFEWVAGRYDIPDPRLGVAILLERGLSLPGVIADLHLNLPAPSELPPGLLDEVLGRLRQWRRYLVEYRAATPAVIVARSDWTWVEIPAALRNDARALQHVDQAIAALAPSGTFRGLPAWPPVDLMELSVRSALVSVCLDYLVRDMQALYRQARQGP